MAASWRTFTHAARHCSSVPYCCSNSASVSPCMIARIAPIPRSPESILHRFRGGRKGGDWLISGFFIRIEAIDATFENAFEIGTCDEFLGWLTSNGGLVFFLDPLNEAQLETPRALGNAIRIFGERIHAAREHAHLHHQPRGCLAGFARPDVGRTISALRRTGGSGE